MHRMLAVAILFAASGSAAAQTPTFVPGERTLFYEDFSAPGGAGVRRLREVSERISVRPHDGRSFLHIAAPGRFYIPLPETLPRQFTIDFDVYIPGDNLVFVSAAGPDGPADGSGIMACGPFRVTYAAGGEEGDAAETDRMPEGDRTVRVMHCGMAVDGPRMQAFVDRVPVISATNPPFTRTNRLLIEFGGVDDPTLLDQNPPVWITNIRVAAGSSAISYDSLVARGRIATRGILFDTGSDRIRPESAPVLQAIVAMLRDHPTLRLGIEGHTDDVGDAAANQALSERRAAAVRAHLVAQGVTAARLESAGFGPSRPAVPNTSAEARQQNRRVELVRLEG